MDFDVIAMAELASGKEKGLLLSSANGKVMVFGGLQRPIMMDIRNQHIQKAANVVLSPCGKYVLTAGEDCVVLVWKIRVEI